MSDEVQNCSWWKKWIEKGVSGEMFSAAAEKFLKC
jgi:hypothetical protein